MNNNDLEVRIENPSDIEVSMSNTEIYKIITHADWEENDPSKEGFIKNKPALFSGDYNDLSNKPTIPTKTSDLTNDSGFIDETYHDNTKQDVLSGSDSIDITSNVVSVKETYKNNIIQESKNYTDKVAKDLLFYIGGKTLEEQTDNTIAYEKTIPSGALKYAELGKVGGMSYKINQLVKNGNFINDTNWNSFGGTNSVSNNELVYTSNANNSVNTVNTPCIGIVGHKYLLVRDIKASTNLNNAYEYWGTSQSTYSVATSYEKKAYIFNYSSGENLNVFRINGTYIPIGTQVYLKNVMLFDLTAMGIDTTDIATATSELLKRGIDINEYQAYDSGSIRDTKTTSVVVSGTDVEDITLPIPAEIQALNGYGWGINDTCYNYIGFENKKYIQKVGRVDLGTLSYTKINATGYFYAVLSGIKIISSGTPNLLNDRYSVRTAINGTEVYSGDKWITQWSTLNRILINDTSYATAEAFKTAMSGVYLYYELATPVETDISQYLDDDFKYLDIENMTNITMENQYKQAVPSEITYLVEVNNND